MENFEAGTTKQSASKNSQTNFSNQNTNNKPDFFTDSTQQFLRKSYNLIMKNNPRGNSGKKEFSTSQIVIIIWGIALIVFFAEAFLPIIAFFLFFYFLNQKAEKKLKETNNNKPETISSLSSQSNFQTSQTLYGSKVKTFNPTDNIQDSFANWIRVVLLIGLIGYCIYFAWAHLQDKFL